MKKTIPLQSPPDFSSLVPPDLQGGGDAPAPPPTTSGMSMDGLSPEEASAIPDQGSATMKFHVHHRSMDKHMSKDGKATEKHSVHMHVHEFEPHATEPAMPKKGKKLMDSTSAADAVSDSFPPVDGTP